MDIATLGGLVLGVTAVMVGFVLEGGHMSAIFQFPAMLIVIGGTLGASMITTSFKAMLSIPQLLKIAMFGKSPDPTDTIDRIVDLAKRARRGGVLELENQMDKVEHPFFRKALQLIIDGTEVTVLTNVLENEMANIEERHRSGVLLFNKMGGFSPTLGIIGTVLALIHTLANTSEPGTMARSIASAFIATLWGVGLANLFYLPIADKLKFRHDEEMLGLSLIAEGTIAIQSGDNPRVIRSRLTSFLQPVERAEAVL